MRPTSSDWDAAGAGSLVSVSKDGTRLLVVDNDDNPTTAQVRDAESGRLITSITLPPFGKEFLGPMFLAAFSPDGRRLVTASRDETAIVWNAETGARMADLIGHNGDVVWIAISPDGGTVATSAYQDDAARTWRTETGEALHRFPHENHVTTAVFHPSQPRLLTTSSDRTARMWSVESGKELGVFQHVTGEAPNPFVRGAEFSADGAQLLTAFENAVVEWNATTFTVRRRFSTDDVRSWAVRPFYADGGRVLVAIGTAAVHVWRHDTATRRPTVVTGWLDRAAAEPTASLLFRDRFLISANPVGIWDLRHDRQLVEFSAARRGLFARGRLLTTNADGLVQSWSLERLLTTPESLAPRCLTPEERTRFFLDPDPPAWCITGPGRVQETDPAKWAPLWPYDTDEWSRWLQDRRRQ